MLVNCVPQASTHREQVTVADLRTFTFLRVSSSTVFRYLRGLGFTCHIVLTWQIPVLMPHSLCRHVVLKRSCSFWLQSIVRASWHITFVEDLGWEPNLWVTESILHRRYFPVFGNTNYSHKHVSSAKYIFHFHVPYFHMCISVDVIIYHLCMLTCSGSTDI